MTTRNNLLSEKRPDLAKEWHLTKNKGLNLNECTCGSGRKVWWKCDKGHEWEATIKNRTRRKKNTCPVCLSLKVVKPELAKEWHPTKNGNLKSINFTCNSVKKIWWKCDKGHEWEATIVSRNSGIGCPYCSGRYATKGINDLATLNPELAKEWHPTKNGNLIPNNITCGCGKKVWWKCEKGHEWKTTIRHRSEGTGCPYCSGRYVIRGETDLLTLNLNLAKEWHPTKNGELTPDVVTVASGRKVWWKCDKGHEWKTTISNRNNGTNCPYCAGQKVCSDNSLNTLNPKIAQEWNYNKNKNLTPNDVTEKSSRKVWWKCEKGHEWEAIIYNRNNGGGCPYCNNNGTSFPEQAIYFYIKQIFKDAVNTHILKVDGKKIEIDIFIPSLNLGIEYDGFFYHKTRVKNDSYKNKKLENKIILVRIREHGLPKLDSEKVKYIQRVNNKRTSLQYDIEKLFDFIKKMDISHELKSKMFSTKINLTKDRYKIIEMSKHLFKNVSLLSRNPLLVKEWHPVKNEGLVPKNFTCFSNVKVWWKCSKGHEWEATISNRNNGTNCPYCTGKRVCLDNSLATLNPKIAQEWNYIKNKSLTPSDVTERSCRKVWWKCDKGHEWVATIYSRNSGCGCPYCSGRLACPNNSLAFLNPKLAEEWHPVKNKNLSPENVKTGSSKKVWWKCSKGHEWEAVIYSRNKGIGCPYCHKKRRLIS